MDDAQGNIVERLVALENRIAAIENGLWKRGINLAEVEDAQFTMAVGVPMKIRIKPQVHIIETTAELADQGVVRPAEKVSDTGHEFGPAPHGAGCCGHTSSGPTADMGIQFGGK